MMANFIAEFTKQEIISHDPEEDHHDKCLSTSIDPLINKDVVEGL